MAKEIISLANVGFETKGVPTIYANHGSAFVSYYEIRVYLSQLMPQTQSAASSQTPTGIILEPHLCLVCAPEFAKKLAEALMSSVERFEEAFGSLRPEPTAEVIVPEKSIPAPSEKDKK